MAEHTLSIVRESLEDELKDAVGSAKIEIGESASVGEIKEEVLEECYQEFAIFNRGKTQVVDITPFLDEPLSSQFREFMERKGKKLKQPSEADIASFQALQEGWEDAVEMRNKLEDQFPLTNKRLHNVDSDFPYVREYWGGDRKKMEVLSAYQMITTPSKGTKGNRILGKRGKPGAEQLEDVMDSLQRLNELNIVLQVIEKIEEREGAKQEVKKEQRRTGKIIGLINKTRESTAKALSISALASIDPEDQDDMVTLLGTDEQAGKHLKTCFTPDLIEDNEFKNVLKKILDGEAIENFVQNPELLPELKEKKDLGKALRQVWERDQQKLEKTREAAVIRERLEKLKEKLLGPAELTDSRGAYSLDEEKVKEITWGKFMEKIMTLVLAEYWKEQKRVKIIPVSNYIDLHAGIDLMVDIQSSQDPQKRYLLGIDFTTQEEGGETTDKSQNTESGILRIEDNESNRELLKGHEDMLGRGSSVERAVVYNPSGMDFSKILLKTLRKALLDKSENEILFSNQFIQSIYKKAHTEFEMKQEQGRIARTQKSPQEIRELCESILLPAA